MVVGELFLVLLDAPIQLVRQRIDGRVHVLVGRIGVDAPAAHLDRRFRLLPQLLDRQDAMHVDQRLEVARDPLELLRDVAAERGRDLDVVTGQVELHGSLLFNGHEHSTCHQRAMARLRSFEGASDMASRYFATVRRATGMPSWDRISAILLSLSGVAGSSCAMSLRILARMAVELVPVPFSPATWL